VLDQTWRDLELIVVDGASTDGTVDVLRRLAAADARVRLVLNDLPEGVSAARNQGARLARGKYLAFQDSDDAWHPEILARQMEALGRRPRARLCYAGVRRTLPSGTYLRPPSWNGTVEGDLHRQLLRASLITTPALVVERALFDEVGGFDERLRFNEDWDLAVRLTARSEVACAKGWLLESSRQPDSLSADRAAQMGRSRRPAVPGRSAAGAAGAWKARLQGGAPVAGWPTASSPWRRR
jgi:glycosyltransferase involved in cell wall biosynthesis